MQKQTEENQLSVLIEIRNWIRASSYRSVRASLEEVLPDAKSRMAYQMLDGMKSMDQVRIACKMSPNALLDLANRCTATGLMEISLEKRRMRLFDLADFGLISLDSSISRGKNCE
jgi:hypothetical protein